MCTEKEEKNTAKILWGAIIFSIWMIIFGLWGLVKVIEFFL